MTDPHNLLSYRILFLSGSIDTDLANQVIARLLLLDAEDHAQPIDLYINSPGGDLMAAIAIIDAMNCIQAQVRTLCIGQAASAAAFILAAGEPGNRAATPNAEIMIHQVNAGIQGSAVDMQMQAERVLRLQENIIRLMARWTGKSEQQLEKDMDRDCYMSAEQAVEYGIIDEVLDPFKS